MHRRNTFRRKKHHPRTGRLTPPKGVRSRQPMPRKAQEPPLITLSVYRLRAPRGRLDEVLVEDPDLQQTTLTTIRGFRQAILVTKPTRARAARWHAFLVKHLPSECRLPLSQSSNALLVLWRQGRVYALAFGTGRFLLKPSCIDDTFGLKTCLNSIAPDKIRTIDRETFEAVHRHTREQAGTATSIAGFGMNLDEDLLRAVTGTPKNPTLGKVLSGREVLHATINIDLADIAPVLDTYEKRANSTDYRKDFAWTDHIQPVPNTQQDTLNDQLVERLQRGDTTRTWLVIPQLLLREDILGFRYNKKPHDPLPNLHLKDYFTHVRPYAKVTLDVLKRDKIGVCADDPQPVLEWTVYQGLYAEHDDDKTTYLLTNGHWYAISRDFVNKVNAALKQTRDADLTLPDYNGPNEAVYNQELARTRAPKKVLFDQKLFKPAGATSPFELCDVYTANKQFVHIKRYGGSSILSHLFAQALVAGQVFYDDNLIRKEFNDRLPTALRHNPDERPGPNEYQVILGIISRSANRNKLPFFSRVTLRRTSQELRRLGYDVRLAFINDKSQPADTGVR